MRRLLTGLVVALLAGVAVPAAWAGQTVNTASITVGKIVNGTAPSGFTVVVTCTVEAPPGGNTSTLQIDATSTLQFDATGAPTTTNDPAWQVQNGQWTLQVSQPPGDASCTATETDTAGATSVAWTCDFDFTNTNGAVPAGCDAPAGSGAGPVNFTFSSDTSWTSQDITVVFTNTFVAAAPAAVEAAPTTTG